MIQNARLMSEDADFERLGLKKGVVEPWEDGIRDTFEAGHFEWWYFDAILDDGTKITASFSTKLAVATHLPGNHPSFVFMINLPDGRFIPQAFGQFDPSEVSYSKESCDVHYGPHFIQGDLKDYHIKAEPVAGVGFDVTLHKSVSSWRGDTGYIGMGEQDERYFTWLCSVPKGSVEGTLTVDGVTRSIKGEGYHDYQWGNIYHAEFLNHWLWARQNIGDYTMLVFDYVLNREYGYARIPLVFIQDKNGTVLFESTKNVQCKVEEEYLMEITGENFPKVTHYTFDNNGRKVDYRLTVKEELEGKDSYITFPKAMQELSDRHDAHPTYGRYLAEGEFSLTEDGREVLHQKGDLIYEFTYIGKSYKEHMET